MSTVVSLCVGVLFGLVLLLYNPKRSVWAYLAALVTLGLIHGIAVVLRVVFP